ncbi:MAG: hypothetical protein ACI308_03405 [Muribaculaceae bacterium]
MEQKEYKKDTKGNKKSIRVMFGLFMIFIYMGMGILVLLGYFDYLPTWARYSLGTLFIVYGAWRCYRYISGIDARV